MSDFKQEFSVLLYQVLRTGGVVLSTAQAEQLRVASDKLVEAIDARARERALELVRKMQTAVSNGFTKIGEDMTRLETRVEALDNFTAKAEEETIAHMNEADNKLMEKLNKRAKAVGRELSPEEAVEVKEKLGIKDETTPNG